MRERPILFNDAMVRAILSGAKTQTRRPVKPQPDGRLDRVVSREHANGWAAKRIDAGMLVTAKYQADGSPLIGTARGRHCHAAKPCPFGVPGDRLWVRECFALGRAFDASRAAELPIVERDVPVWYRADGAAEESWANRGKWRPSIHMPRWASRLTLRVTDVRVERVQEITEEDARAEGVEPVNGHPERGAVFGVGPCHREGFAQAWCDTYGPESWDANDWVWVRSFEREEVRDA